MCMCNNPVLLSRSFLLYTLTLVWTLQAKLEEAVSLATGFQTSLQDTINWLTQAEQTLNMAQPPSLMLDTVLFQIDEHKVCFLCSFLYQLKRYLSLDCNISLTSSALWLSRCLWMRWTPTESRSWLWRRPALSFASPAWSRTSFSSRTCCSASRLAGTSWCRGHWTAADTSTRHANAPNRYESYTSEWKACKLTWI